jgi:hypothetical protein
MYNHRACMHVAVQTHFKLKCAGVLLHTADPRHCCMACTVHTVCDSVTIACSKRLSTPCCQLVEVNLLCQLV